MNLPPLFNSWKRTNATTFWSEIAPCDHVVQIYENDNSFLETLTGYVGAGINAGDCVVVIATAVHLEGLKQRLNSYGVHVQTLRDDDRYIALNAEETLAKFMINGWPDEDRFHTTVRTILEKAHERNRPLRAFGEMVAVLWAQGHHGATVRLEALWNQFCRQNQFPLFCAYPKSGFTQDINKSIRHICSAHTTMVRSAGNRPGQEIEYKAVH